jgi:hypothetical protein
MLAGLFKRFTNSRIPMAAKELRWELEEMSESERAQCVYQATLFRLLRLELELNKAVMAPVDFSPDHCKKVYYTIEGAYLQTKQQSKQNLQMIRAMQQANFGGEGDSGSVVKCSVAGIKLLMVTAGVRVNVNAFDDVQRSWELAHDGVQKNLDLLSGFYNQSKYKQQVEQQALTTGDPSHSYLEAILAIPRI